MFFEIGDHALIQDAYTKAYKTPSPDSVWDTEERRVWNIFDQCPELGAVVKECVKTYLGDDGTNFLQDDYCANRVLLFSDRAHLNTHCDDREGDVTACIFLTGPGEGKEINTVGNPRFQLEDPARYPDQTRLPYQDRPAYSVNPRPGLITVFPSWIPHNMHPFKAKKPDDIHAQIVAHYRLDIPDEYVSENFE